MAKVGEQLLQPEPGWRRYDVTSLKIGNSWSRVESSKYYNGVAYRINNKKNNEEDFISFKFKSPSLRLISASSNANEWNTEDAFIIIDGVSYSFSTVFNVYNQYQTLSFEKLNLPDVLHEAKISYNQKSGNTTQYLYIDAIDIHEDGHICEANCTLPHGAKYLLKNNLTNELYTLSASDELIKLDTNVIDSQQFINHSFDNITLLNKHTSILNSNYSILTYTEENYLTEARATFRHEPKSLLNENYDLLMLSDTDGTLKLNAIPHDQVVKGNGDIDLSGIKKLDKIELVSNNIKAALSFDSGATWRTLVDGVWITLDITNVNEFNTKGMTNTLLAEVPGTKLEELRGESSKLRLAYLLSQEELNSPAYTDSLSLKITLAGKDTIAANSEWSYKLLDDLETLEYTFNQNGTYTINYAY